MEVSGKPDQAVQALETVLNAWKGQKQVASLKEQTPPVIVRDEDWESGASLKSFEIQPEPIQDGGCWQVKATLELGEKAQRQGRVLVAYSVTVSPVVSVLRSDQPQ